MRVLIDKRLATIIMMAGCVSAIAAPPGLYPERLEICDYFLTSESGGARPVKGEDHIYLYRDSASRHRDVTSFSPEHGTVVYPIIGDKRIVALLGHVYQTKDGTHLTRVTDNNVLAQVGVAHDSLIVPLQVDGRGYGQMGLKVFLKEVIRDERGGLVARVRAKEDKESTEKLLRRGDVLEGAGKTFVVRNISRGGEALIAGCLTNCWLELGPVEKKKQGD